MRYLQSCCICLRTTIVCEPGPRQVVVDMLLAGEVSLMQTTFSLRGPMWGLNENEP